ncbi:hypothetical protein R4Y45_04365 [Holzapfeliella sp. He02]|uniref:CAAX prenyl protease 2/Lysostaphin resistance protein A-like domain-containing protein n=1 Tax=Holzapfeliella saturejae TaxID=3082953 RepID=A0ABU8SGE3_9LACO
MNNNYVKTIGYYVGWLVLFAFTPGLINYNFGVAGLFNQSDEVSVWINSAVMLLVFLSLIFFDWQKSRSYFLNNLSKRSALIVVAIILISLATLPFHYKMIFHVVTYAFWMFSSVVWQNYVSFGWLYGRLSDIFSKNISQLITTLAFASGHVIYIWQKFGLTQPVSLIFILLVALLLSSLRRFTGNISWQIAIHLAFYYLLS